MPLDRRQFLKNSAIAGAGVLLTGEQAGARAKAPSEKLNIGVVGVANRGADDLDGVKGENIVALCDVDDTYLARASQQFPQAKTYNDYRKMLEQKGIDAVVIATPDHTHAVITLAALESGRHVYCEKPLAHTVWEARQVAETAKKHRRVTQMGTQIHAGSNYRRVVELLQTGAIGPVSEIHVWADRAWAGTPLPSVSPPVPSNLHWDLWQGPIPEQPYHPEYVPAYWRGYWAYGSGTLGDMACHHMDLSYWAFHLRYPETVSAEGPPLDPVAAPAWLMVHYTFPAIDKQPPIKLTWYNGGKRPPHFADGRLPAWGDGSLFIGEKGMLLADYGSYKLLPEKDFVGFKPPTPFIPDSIGHHQEWIEACKTNGPTTCNFDYSGALSEAVLLGNVAYRTGQTIEWDPKRLKAKHNAAADHYLRPEYRKDWNKT